MRIQTIVVFGLAFAALTGHAQTAPAKAKTPKVYVESPRPGFECHSIGSPDDPQRVCRKIMTKDATAKPVPKPPRHAKKKGSK